MPLFAFAIDKAVAQDEVPRGVSVVGIELGGLSRDDALAALRGYESDLGSIPLVYVVDDETFTIEPVEFGFDIDEVSIVDAAFAQGPTGFFDWLTGFNDTVVLQIETTFDAVELNQQLDVFEQEAIAEPAFQGDIRIEDGVAVPSYPRAGQGIDRTGVEAVTLAMVQGESRSDIVLTTQRINPELVRADFDAAVDEINSLIGSPITLTTTDPDFEFTISAAELASVYEVAVVTNSPTTIDMGFDVAAVAALLDQYRSEVEQPARDAEFALVEVNDAKVVEMRPGRSATLLDVDLALAAIEEAATSSGGVAEMPLAEGEPAAFTTEDAEAMMPITEVSSWTTRYTAGQPRVRNIQRFADTIDGATVWPGDSFSLNSYVGERTKAKGYVEAPMISGGELVDSVGGGVSQFATTFYNAVFYGCYEDITHKPHSYYFTRYPEVNEATISWPQPDLEFRNDSDAIIIIDTSHTRTSVTVTFYGNNGECDVERVLGKRFNYTNPQEQFEGDATVAPGSQKIEQNGAIGWSNTVKRIMRWPDGTEIEQEWFWRYRAQPRIIFVHPCDLEDSEEECPIVVPSVIGKKRGVAANQLRELGFTVSFGPTIPVENESDDNRVLTQSVAGGDFIAAGSTIVLQVGEFTPPPDE